MIFGMPLVFWLGLATIISVFTTISLGIAMHVYHKPVFKYHKAMAFATGTLAVIHAIVAYLFLTGTVL